MHTVDACISCMDDIDLLKMGQRKKKIWNECNKKFNHEVVHHRMWFWHSDIDCPDKITNKSRQG